VTGQDNAQATLFLGKSHWIGSRKGLGTNLDLVEKRKITALVMNKSPVLWMWNL